ncbi:DUF3027 domain-containing protein [Brevibacterium litoralis]|uniref:DUF3027 domain-containing protein n=1 Tax=Brevibacterium litoralis TaxID=3138935 RepID=UPI0032EF38AD
MSELFARWSDAAGKAAASRAAPTGVEQTAPVASGTQAGPGQGASAATVEGTTEETKPRARRARPAKPAQDAILLAAVDVARSAIAEVADPAHIGDHLGAVMEGQRLATHSFVCTDRRYRGWHWVAVLARAPRSKKVTVCETALLPGDEALVAPAWVPWEKRVQPGDMTPKDTLPKVDDDPNLEPGLAQVDWSENADIDQLQTYELGLGRTRVLSPEGIRAAATRWEESEAGPGGEYAQKASAPCSTCGYLMPMAGSFRTRFGVCANAWSPFDGRVVALDAGCGAHSETDHERSDPQRPSPVVDDLHEDLDVVGGDPGRTGAASSGDLVHH